MSAPANDKNTITFSGGTVVSGFEPMGRLVIALAEAKKGGETLPDTWGKLKKFVTDKKLDVILKGTGYGNDSYNDMQDSDPINIEPYDSNYKLRIMLPSYDDMLMSVEEAQELTEMNTYPLPKFYSRLAFDGQTKNIEDPATLLLHRIGEYTTQKCR